MILVTGGAGFRGANFILEWIAAEGSPVVNLDKLTYAGNLRNLATLANDARHIFVRGDINDRALLCRLLAEHRPRAIVHFAAESHVDRSIHAPGEFVETNVRGTFSVLEEARIYWSGLPPSERESFRYLQVSTDEVYGSLSPEDPPSTELAACAPSSPYSASKAAADHFVRAYHHTYALPTLVANCSNNYGPYQFPEKLIPLVIHNALAAKPLPVYGDGLNVRDWLYVIDTCSAIRAVLAGGRAGETYNVGGSSEKPNIDVVRTVCALLDEARPRAAGTYAELITFVEDRPGHDRRYALDATKIARELNWRPQQSFEAGLKRTVKWYLENETWVRDVTSGAYRSWVEKNYTRRGAA